MNPLERCNQPENVLNALQEMIKIPRGFILLAGKNGTGKTFAARCVWSELSKYFYLCKHFEEPIFITQADLNLEWIKRQNEYGETTTYNEMLRKSKLLILDDLGTRVPTESFMDFIYSFIDYRYNHNLATIITTNLNAKDMREKFGDAFVSRVASGTVFRLEGPDRRFKEF